MQNYTLKYIFPYLFKFLSIQLILKSNLKRFVLLFFIVLLSSCADEKQIPIKAEKVIIDLSNKITESEEVIVLKGEW